MGVPYTFGTATTSIPLSQLDANFNTPVTLGNTTVGLGNTVTTVGNLTLTNVTITSGTINAAVVDSGYVANSVVYANSTGVLTAGSANFVFDGTNVGIGTSSPQGKLDVSSSSAGVTAGDLVVDTANKTVFVGRLSSTSADNGKLVVRNRVGDALTITGDTAPDGTGLYRPGTNLLGFTTNGSERMRITSSGDVGIGTTSPNAKLEVQSSGTSTSAGGNISGRFSSNGSGYAASIQFSDSVANAAWISMVSADLIFGPATTERMRIDSSGNVSLGTTTPGYLGNPTDLCQIAVNRVPSSGVITNSARSAAFINLDGSSGGSSIQFATAAANNTNPTERMRITSGGNLGVGTASPHTGSLVTFESNGGQFRIRNTTTRYRSDFSVGSSGGLNINAYDDTGGVYQTVELDGNPIRFNISGSERARFDSSGNLLVGTTNSSVTAGVGVKVTTVSGALVHAVVVDSDSATGVSNYHHYNVNATFNGYRFYVTNNGGISNFSANNTNLSDERVKTNIELAGNYLNKICSIPVKVFNYKDEPTGEQRSLGVIAQDVEAVAPELVSNDGWLGRDEFDTPLKSVYETDMMFALMKCIQEQQAMIVELTNRIKKLEGV